MTAALAGWLGRVGRHGRACLVAGLVCGFALPGLATAMKPWLPEIVALMIFTAAFRIGPRAALGQIADLRASGGAVLLLQVALPVMALGLFLATGLAATPVALAVTLMLSAPSISGSPNLTILLRHEPAPAPRLMILGTAVFPVTVLPVLAALPGLGEAEVFRAGARLLTTIGIATALAFLLRSKLAPVMTGETRDALDGFSAILMSVAVVGLMAGLSPGLRADPIAAVGWIALAFALNFGLQIVIHRLFRHRPDRVPMGVVAGNRNIALFLVALPQEVTDPILIFIGAYQLPMYLTPVLMGWLYGHPPGPRT